MTNSSTPNMSDPLLLNCLGYFVQGVLIGPANLMVVLSILRYGALKRHKEYNLIMALSLADTINMFAFASRGAHRLVLYFGDGFGELVDWHYCLKLPHVWLWTWCHINAQFMLLFVSADRLMSVAFPLYYITLTVSYVRRVMMVSLCWTSLIGLLSTVTTYSNTSLLYRTDGCSFTHILYLPPIIVRLHSSYYHWSPPISGIVSILLYSLVLPVYRCRRGQFDHSRRNDQELQRQLKMTRSLAISCLCTLLFYVIPYIVSFWAWFAGQRGLAEFMFIFTSNNALANVFIYNIRHSEMRLALRSMLRGKELPPALQMWKVEQSISPEASNGQERIELKSTDIVSL